MRNINASRILYAEAPEGHPVLDPGHWFFHEGQWVVCASAGAGADGGWGLHIYFAAFDKPLSDFDFRFESLEGAKRFVSDYFECAVVECGPDEFPRPDTL